MKFIFFKFTTSFIAVLVLFVVAVFAQTERDTGIELFKQGKNKEAVAALEKASKKFKTDAEIWNYLGLAYIKADSLKKAVKAIGKAVKLDAQSATYQTNLAYAYFLGNKLERAREESTKALQLNPQSADALYVRGSAEILRGKYDEAIADAERAVAANVNYAAAYTLKSDALLYKFGNGIIANTKPEENLRRLAESRTALEDCLKTCRDNPQEQVQRERLEAVNTFYSYYERRKNTNLTSPISVIVAADAAAAAPTVENPNLVPLRVLSKPKPSYTDKARQENVQGTISVLVMFAASGRVTHTIVLRGLGLGLNENAVKAARKIVFEPARENGIPISQIRIVEYGFAIY